jgi:hypothetical protein
MLGKSVNVSVHPGWHIKITVWDSTVLMCFHPREADLEMEAVQTISNQANDVSVMAHAASFGTGFLCMVYFFDGSLVVDPKNNFTFGVKKAIEGTKVVEEFNDCRGAKQLCTCGTEEIRDPVYWTSSPDENIAAAQKLPPKGC